MQLWVYSTWSGSPRIEWCVHGQYVSRRIEGLLSFQKLCLGAWCRGPVGVAVGDVPISPRREKDRPSNTTIRKGERGARLMEK